MSPPDGGSLRRDLDDSPLRGLDIGEQIGEGSRCLVYAAKRESRDCALKVYKQEAVVKHARRSRQELAEYEHTYNTRYFHAPGLAEYVAEPLGFAVTPRVSAFLQERLHGPLYYDWYQARGGEVPDAMWQHVARIVERAHAAGIFGVDLHALNVVVAEGAGGEPIPKLFDFNRLPRHEHHPNRFLHVLCRTGLLSPQRLDLKALRNFHNFRRIERKLRKYDPTNQAAP